MFSASPTSLRRIGVAAALAFAAPAGAVPVVGSFTGIIIGINNDETQAPPEFTDQAPFTGRFGYDTSLATDSDPDPDRGVYAFTSSAFVSITVNGATYTTDPSLAPVTVALGRFPGAGSQTFTIRGGLVPQEQLADASNDFPLEITLVNGLSGPPFVPSDALPTASFSLAAFSDPDGFLGGADSTPYTVIFQLKSLDINVVPEPAAIGLFLLGAIGIATVRRRSMPKR